MALLVAAGPACAQSPAAAPEAGGYPRGQLGDTARPLAYRLDLTLDPAKPRFGGKVEIDVNLARPGTTIFLHGRDLAVQRATARIGKREIAGAWRQLDPTGVASLSFAEPLPAGSLTLAFDYDAAFADNPAGAFRVKVSGEWYSWTQFESIDARAAFPGFDQPSFKTPFTVTLRTPAGLTAIANAPEVSRTTEGGLDVHRFAPTLPLPTYLIAFMVGPFASVAGEVPPTAERPQPLPLRIVSTRPNAGKLGFALENSKRILPLLEDYFGTPFPFPKLDQITSPIMPGAMENAGADLYADRLLVLDERAPVHRQRQFGMVVSHELAHQWFGDLVTPVWWNDIWLNESFANWMGYRTGAQWRPDLEIAAGATAEGFAAMRADSLLAGRPIRQTIASNDQVDAAFDAITYGKGGHVVAMVAAYMGDDRFRDGVRRYMAAHARGNATSDDFFAAMADAAGDPGILAAMRGFVEQQGVPLLTFSQDGEEWRVVQSRYAPLGVTPPPTRWNVPVCLRRAAERLCRMVGAEEATFTFAGRSPEPLVPNAGGAGYYRFELSRHEWGRLIAVADGLPAGEAIAVADSLGASFLAGHATFAQLVALARQLARNPDSHASEAATAMLGDLVAIGLQPDAREGWHRFLARIYGPQVRALGFDPRAGVYDAERPNIAQRRLQAVERLASSGRNRPLRDTLHAAASGWLAGDAAALDPTWFGLAFGEFLSRGGLDAAKRLADRALASEDPQFRPVALASLAASGQEPIARWLLEEMSDSRLRSSERLSLLGGILSAGRTRNFGFWWMQRHLDEILSGNGIFWSTRLPQMLTGYCSNQRADEVAAVLRARLAGTPGALELDRTLETIRNCAVLVDVRGPEIAEGFAGLR